MKTRRVVIRLPNALYRDLTELAARAEERGYGPASFATDLVCSELAARRLPKIAPARNGAGFNASEPELEEA